MQEVEEWKEIEGCKGYKVSNLGNVLGRRGRKLKLQCNKSGGGYYMFRMPHMDYGKTIHRVVAIAFIPNPLNLPEVNHKNGIKSDNRVENLEWCTRVHNMRHAHDTGLKKNKGSRKIFTDVEYGIIVDCFNEGFTNVAIAKYFGCHQSTIAYIHQGKRQNYTSPCNT